MNTFPNNNYDSLEQLIFINGLRIKGISFNTIEQSMEIVLNTPLVLTVPYKSIATLANATPEDLNHFELIGKGAGIHWPKLDEDLSLKGFLKDFLNELFKNGGTYPILNRIKAVA
jgi:hypothetical protein